jgi:hypothetical protein
MERTSLVLSISTDYEALQKYFFVMKPTSLIYCVSTSYGSFSLIFLLNALGWF